jgi:hypothetical protein
MPGLCFGADLPRADRRRLRSMLVHPSVLGRALQALPASEWMARPPSSDGWTVTGPSTENADRLEQRLRSGLARRAWNERIERTTVRLGEPNPVETDSRKWSPGSGKRS